MFHISCDANLNVFDLCAATRWGNLEAVLFWTTMSHQSFWREHDFPGKQFFLIIPCLGMVHYMVIA